MLLSILLHYFVNMNIQHNKSLPSNSPIIITSLSIIVTHL